MKIESVDDFSWVGLVLAFHDLTERGIRIHGASCESLKTAIRITSVHARSEVADLMALGHDVHACRCTKRWRRP